MKFSNYKGITIISLVITIIVMIIIAGVIISNVIGENSAIDKAEYSKEEEEYKSKKDALQQYLTKYNSKSFVGSDDFGEFLQKEMGLTEADYTHIPGEGVDYYQIKYLGEDFFIKIIDGIGELSGVPEDLKEKIKYIETGDKVISPDTGLEDNKSYAIIENVNLNDFSFDIPANTNVTIKLLSDLEITNANLDKPRAAINLNEGATLNLQVEANITVNSTFGESADITVAGKGGYAGIHVPTGTTLNLSGGGVITCYGGDAGDGGTMLDASITGNDKKCAGGGGAGAGIGGNGGTGGAYVSGKGANGGNGESCGTVNITGSLTVYAYGGAGGSGGAGTITTATAGGGGGYPAAGIGGGGAGGAGGTCCSGAGGYSGGTGEQDTTQSHNGLAGGSGPKQYKAPEDSKIGGSGYFQGAYGVDQANVDRAVTVFGGKGNQGWHSYSSHGSGDGGTAGSGGAITVSSNNKIYAYNGNLYSDGKNSMPCPIYLQAGIKNAQYTYISQGNNVSRWKFLLKQTATKSTVSKTNYKNANFSQTININEQLGISGNPLSNVDMSKQGVGSGAGYIEVSNGTYKVK